MELTPPAFGGDSGVGFLVGTHRSIPLHVVLCSMCVDGRVDLSMVEGATVKVGTRLNTKI